LPDCGFSRSGTHRKCFGGTTLAFTEVGSQVIRIRGRHFKDRFLGPIFDVIAADWRPPDEYVRTARASQR
jgi:hypothetical protein